MTAAAPGSNRSARADAQRDRILTAAEKCFAERGFHAASMAMIAETAVMSPGLIYRYFDSKAAIIHGIVERQLDRLAQDLLRPEARQRDLVSLLVASYCHRRDAATADCGTGHGLEPALLLEITAEASRDPQIARTLGQFDALIGQAIRDWLMRPGSEGGWELDPQQAHRRELVLRCIIDGLKMRQAREPDLDPQLLRAALEEALPRVLDAATAALPIAE